MNVFGRARAAAKLPRDGQRARLYRAETDAFAAHPEPAWRLPSVTAVEAFVRDVLDEDWFRVRFGTFSRVTVKDGRGTRHAYSAYEPVRRSVALSFPRWARTKPVVLHELGHAASLRRHGVIAAHGPEFAAVYLQLVARHLGPAAGVHLRRAFDAHRVRHAAATAAGPRAA